jgi:hypothetical protein
MTTCDASQNNLAKLKRPERRPKSRRARTDDGCTGSKRAQNTAVVPPGFPRPQCLNGTKLFKALYGDPPRSTWAKWKKDGIIPAPDKQIGKLSFWWEEKMWRTLTGDEEAAAR